MSWQRYISGNNIRQFYLKGWSTKRLEYGNLSAHCVFRPHISVLPEARVTGVSGGLGRCWESPWHSECPIPYSDHVFPIVRSGLPSSCNPLFSTSFIHEQDSSQASLGETQPAGGGIKSIAYCLQNSSMTRISLSLPYLICKMEIIIAASLGCSEDYIR